MGLTVRYSGQTSKPGNLVIIIIIVIWKKLDQE